MGRRESSKYSIYTYIAIFVVSVICMFVIKWLNEKTKPTDRALNTFHLYNDLRSYGDHILNLKFFYVNAHILKEKDIFIHYYYNDKYIKDVKELENYVNPDVIQLHTTYYKPDDAINIQWGPIDGYIFTDFFDEYFYYFYKKLLIQIGIKNIPINTSIFQEEPYLLDIYKELDPKFQDIDVLFFNNIPRERPGMPHYEFDKELYDDLAIRLIEKHPRKLKVVVLRPVGNIPSTHTDGLSLQQIGAISTHARYIIGIDTGALTGCFNTYTKKHVKKWIIFGEIEWKEVNFIRLYTKEDMLTAEKYIL